MGSIGVEQSGRTRDRAAIFLKTAFEVLEAAGGTLPFRDIKKEVAKRIALTEHDLDTLPKSGYVRWESVLHFYSIDAAKAGFIRKQGGAWSLTEEGRKVMTLTGEEILNKATTAYRAWKAEQPNRGETQAEEPRPLEAGETERKFVFESAEGDARSEIEDHVSSLNPYEFQDLVAALLRGMGYTTPFVAPRGPDGGTDILAYPDPIGAQTPHVRVQVKHRSSQKATNDEVAALKGRVKHEREMGLFVSTAGFTPQAVQEAKGANVHIELMDLGQLLDAWIKHYDQIGEDDRYLLPLRRVHFLAPE